MLFVSSWKHLHEDLVLLCSGVWIRFVFTCVYIITHCDSFVEPSHMSGYVWKKENLKTNLIIYKLH